jgi:FecR protein
MSLVKRVIAALLLTGAAALLLASSALAQGRVGVVTNIEGFATVARVALPEPKPLHFKDDLFLRDRITTGERSIVRVLLGGKATVTARERSVLTITEVPGVATINLGAGRIAVAVAKGLMKPGEVIEIKTPNAVTAIRGTVVIAEVEPVPQGYQSTITILRGLVDVTRLDPAGALTGPAVKVGALERVTVVNAQPVPAPQKITRDAASRLAADFSFVPKNAPAASTEALGAEAKDITMRDAMQIVGAVSPAPSAGTSGQDSGAGTIGQGGPRTAGQGVTGGVSAAVGGVTNTATGALGAVTGGVTGTLNGVTGAATGVVTGLTSPVTQAVAPVVNPVTSPATNLVTTVTNTVNNVTNPVTNPILPGLLRKP